MGYSVRGGTINAGTLSTESPTEILSRNVVFSGKVSAEELNVVAGNNYVDVNGKVKGPVSASGLAGNYSIDVSRLGGMYANKIQPGEH